MRPGSTSDVTDKPVGRRDCQDVEQDKDHLRVPLATIVLSRVGLSGHLSRPPASTVASDTRNHWARSNPAR